MRYLQVYTCVCVCVCVYVHSIRRRLAADPFDIEAQRRIEEIIQQRNIEENFMNAMEHNPEVCLALCVCMWVIRVFVG